MKPVLLDIFIGVIFASIGQLLFKLGAVNFEGFSISSLSHFFNVYIIFGLIFYAIGSVFWIIALSKADLSYVYPFIALTFISVYLLSVFILKEPVHLNRIGGIAVVIAGLFIMFYFDKP